MPVLSIHSGPRLDRIRDALNWLVRPGFGGAGPRRLLLDRNDIADPGRIVVPKGRRKLAIEIPESATLVREVAIPKGARRHVSQVVDTALRQSLPRRGQDMVWRHGPPKTRPGGTMVVDAYVTKQSTLDALLARLGPERVSSVGIAGQSAAPPFHRHTGRRWGGGLLWALVGISVPVLTAFPALQADRMAVLALRTEIVALRQRLEVRTAELAELRAESERRLRDAISAEEELQLLRESGGRLAVLSRLTDVLDDETWIASLSINGEVLRLDGYSASDVSAVLAELTRADWIADARFSGPISRDPVTGDPTFEIEARIEPGVMLP